MPHSAKDRASVPTVSAEERESFEAMQTLEETLGEKVPPIVLSSNAAFKRDLPQLLKDHYMEWVAYSGHERIGIGPSKTELYQQCLRQGRRRGEFVIRSIEPQFPREFDSPRE